MGGQVVPELALALLIVMGLAEVEMLCNLAYTFLEVIQAVVFCI